MSIKFFVDKTGKTAKCVSNPNFYAHKLNTKFQFIEQFNTQNEHPPSYSYFIYPRAARLFFYVLFSRR